LCFKQKHFFYESGIGGKGGAQDKEFRAKLDSNWAGRKDDRFVRDGGKRGKARLTFHQNELAKSEGGGEGLKRTERKLVKKEEGLMGRGKTCTIDGGGGKDRTTEQRAMGKTG